LAIRNKREVPHGSRYFFSSAWAFDVGFDYRKDEFEVDGERIDYVLDTDWYGAVVGVTYRR
jgi:hypothetical protein